MASWAAAPQSAPGPISFDHAVVRAVDVAAGLEFAVKILGLRESSRIVAPDGIPVLSFYRAHTLYHCYAVARSQYDGLHHLQFTLKDPLAVYAAAEKLKANGKIEVIWGPLRHGAGHNIAFYFRDYTGNIVEFSAEEESSLIQRRTSRARGRLLIRSQPMNGRSRRFPMQCIEGLIGRAQWHFCRGPTLVRSLLMRLVTLQAAAKDAVPGVFVGDWILNLALAGREIQKSPGILIRSARSSAWVRMRSQLSSTSLQKLPGTATSLLI